MPFAAADVLSAQIQNSVCNIPGNDQGARKAVRKRESLRFHRVSPELTSRQTLPMTTGAEVYTGFPVPGALSGSMFLLVSFHY